MSTLSVPYFKTGVQPATSGEVAAYVVDNKYISPYTLSTLFDANNGIPQLSESGHLVGRIILPTVTGEVLATNEIGVRSNNIVLGDGITAGGLFLPTLTTDAAVLVQRGSTDIENGDNLRAAYAQATGLTPGGSGLSAANRATVLVPPGRYDFVVGNTGSHGLELVVEYVDLFGLGYMDNIWITSSISGSNRGTIEQAANNVVLTNLTLEITGSGNGDGTYQSRPSAYFPSGDLTATKLVNIRCIGDDNTTSHTRKASRNNIVYAGQYYNWNVSGLPFNGFDAVASGEFYNCKFTWGNDIGSLENKVAGTLDNCILNYNAVVPNTSQKIAVNSGAVVRNCIFKGDTTIYDINNNSTSYAYLTNNTYTGGIGPNVINLDTTQHKNMGYIIYSPETPITTGENKFSFPVPDVLHNTRLHTAYTVVDRPGLSGTTEVQLSRVRSGAADNILSTRMAISTGTDSRYYATPPVINGTYSKVLSSSGDFIRVDIPVVHSGYAPSGLKVIMGFY